MERLNTIQKRENLNEVYRFDGPGAGGACHVYMVTRADDPEAYVQAIMFQHGPRKDESSEHGVSDQDLLEMVRDRLKAFQAGPMASEYNAHALTHIEEALMWMNRRVEDRIERGVLGTMGK